jgi:hypothetical protein
LVVDRKKSGDRTRAATGLIWGSYVRQRAGE